MDKLEILEIVSCKALTEIGELFNLRKLDLNGNVFTRLDFSLVRLINLKRLDLSYCENLVELPKLPSSLAFLKADRCESLEVIRDDAHRRCKWLCQVSIRGGGKNIFSGGEKLLESMLQGEAVKSGCMILRLKGSEIARGFKPGLVRGWRCRMKLQENWYNHFSGFLFCATSRGGIDPIIIGMKHLEKSVGGGSNYWKEVVEETFDDVKANRTWVTYIPFSVLRHTSWWDPTSTAVEVDFDNSWYPSNKIRKCGLKPVPKGAAAAAECSSSETTPTRSSSSSDNDDYKCKLHIVHDSESAINFKFCDI